MTGDVRSLGVGNILYANSLIRRGRVHVPSKIGNGRADRRR